MKIKLNWRKLWRTMVIEKALIFLLLNEFLYQSSLMDGTVVHKYYCVADPLLSFFVVSVVYPLQKLLEDKLIIALGCY